jgi:hypothetical protein
MARINRILAQVINEHYRGCTTNYLVQTPAGVLYIVYIDDASDVVFIKSTDSGLNWSNPTTVFTGTVIHLSIWYDRWSNISAGLIHIAYTETGGSDVYYRSIDTESADTLAVQTQVFDGASAAAANGHLSICRARGGNLYCAFNIDAGAEEGFSRSTDVGATWGARTSHAEAAALDRVLLLPGWAADNQDMIMIFGDQSASEISRKLYDDSGDAWAESSIAASMTLPNNTDWPFMSAAVDITNSRNVLVAWSARDTANADLRCWTITESAITEVTNVVLNSTDDQATCGIAIDTGSSTWYAFYAGKSDGSETVTSSLNVYYKTSTDSGSTWGSETAVTTNLRDRRSIMTCPRFTGAYIVELVHNNASSISLMSLSFNIADGGGVIGG